MSEYDNAANVRAGVYDGEFWWADRSAQPPYDSEAPLPAPWEPLGYIDEPGPEVSNLHNEGSATAIRAWQKAAVVKTIYTPSDARPTFKVPLIETKKEVIEAAFNTTVSADGSYTIDPNQGNAEGSAALDVIDGDSFKRYYLPEAEITAVELGNYANTGKETLTLTIVSQGKVTVWDTRLADISNPPNPPDPPDPGEPDPEPSEPDGGDDGGDDGSGDVFAADAIAPETLHEFERAVKEAAREVEAELEHAHPIAVLPDVERRRQVHLVRKGA